MSVKLCTDIYVTKALLSEPNGVSIAHRQASDALDCYATNHGYVERIAITIVEEEQSETEKAMQIVRFHAVGGYVAVPGT